MKKKIRKADTNTSQNEGYVLSLYVAGTSPQSVRALENIKGICEGYLNGKYSLKVIDIYQQPASMKTEQIIAAPTLIKRQPLPLRRLIGDMANIDRVLTGLDLSPGESGLPVPA
ncbi:MAG: circadian clock KaiB family protein [Gammaproteobacteria bacterium]